MSIRPGARGFFQSRSAAGWQNPYVTDGLVAMWDGIWNVGGWMEHDNATPVWFDCVSGKPIILSNISQNFVASGVELVSSLNNNSQTGPLVGGPLGNGDSYNWVYAEYVITVRSGGNDLIIPMSCGSRVGVWLHKSGNSIGNNSTVRDSSFTFPGLSFASLPVSLSIGFSYSGFSEENGSDIWVNGLNNGTKNGPSDSWSNVKLRRDAIANTYNGAAMYTGPLVYHALRYYSRALTASEIAANYAVDKERFNLP